MYCTITYIDVVNKTDFSKIEGFDWDVGNIDKSWKKHLVSSKEAEEVFINKYVFYFDEKHSQKEDRYVLYGVTNNKRLLIVVFTLRKGLIRVVSARDQNKKERSKYEKENKTNS